MIIFLCVDSIDASGLNDFLLFVPLSTGVAPLFIKVEWKPTATRLVKRRTTNALQETNN